MRQKTTSDSKKTQKKKTITKGRKRTENVATPSVIDCENKVI